MPTEAKQLTTRDIVAARYYFQDYHDHTPMADTLAEVIAPLTEDQRCARPVVPIEER